MSNRFGDAKMPSLRDKINEKAKQVEIESKKNKKEEKKEVEKEDKVEAKEVKTRRLNK